MNTAATTLAAAERRAVARALEQRIRPASTCQAPMPVSLLADQLMRELLIAHPDGSIH